MNNEKLYFKDLGWFYKLALLGGFVNFLSLLAIIILALLGGF